MQQVAFFRLPFFAGRIGGCGGIASLARDISIEVMPRTAEKVEIVLTLSRGVYADEVIPQLYAHTDCEVSLSSNLVMIKERRLVEMCVAEVLCYHTDRLRELIRADNQ